MPNHMWRAKQKNIDPWSIHCIIVSMHNLCQETILTVRISIIFAFKHVYPSVSVPLCNVLHIPKSKKGFLLYILNKILHNDPDSQE